MNKADLLPTLEKQNEIIRIQSGIIDEIFLILLQHMDAEEAGGLPCMERMKQAAGMREEISACL